MTLQGCLLVVTLLLAQLVAATECAEVQNSNSAQLIAFLKESGGSSESGCVAQAIVRLGAWRDPAGTAVLISFLAFQRPATELEEGGLVDLHDRYPAVPALFSIGSEAVPALVNAIASGQLNDLATRNAIRAVSLIYRDTPPDSIKVFQKAGKSSNDPASRKRLQLAAEAAAKLCISSWHERCEHQLFETNRH